VFSGIGFSEEFAATGVVKVTRVAIFKGRMSSSLDTRNTVGFQVDKI
jgi:hypothetical protein